MAGQKKSKAAKTKKIKKEINKFYNTCELCEIHGLEWHQVKIIKIKKQNKLVCANNSLCYKRQREKS